jgi:hypothetical protein
MQANAFEGMLGALSGLEPPLSPLEPPSGMEPPLAPLELALDPDELPE